MTTQTHPIQEIEAVLASMFARWNRADLDAYASSWVDDADLVNVLGMHHHGRRAILDELRWLHQTIFQGSQITDRGHSVRFLAPDVAVVHVRWDMNHLPDGTGYEHQGGVRQGVFTHIMRRTESGWRIIASQNTEVSGIPEGLRITDQQAVR